MKPKFFHFSKAFNDTEGKMRVVTIVGKVEKIKDVIGSGGKTINKIIDETGVKIDIEEDGKVFIYSKYAKTKK